MSDEKAAQFREIWNGVASMVENGVIHEEVYTSKTESVFVEWMLRHDRFFIEEKQEFLETMFDEVFDDYFLEGDHQREKIRPLVKDAFRSALKELMDTNRQLFLEEYWYEFHDYMQGRELTYDSAILETVDHADDELQDECIQKLREVVQAALS